MNRSEPPVYRPAGQRNLNDVTERGVCLRNTDTKDRDRTVPGTVAALSSATVSGHRGPGRAVPGV
eukprot:601421-Hanusia_phi.AAC.3